MLFRNATRAWLAALLALVLVAAACGDDSSGDSDSGSPGDDAEADDDSGEADDDSGETADDSGETDEEPLPPNDDETPDEEPEGPNLEGDLVGLFGLDSAVCDVAGSESGSFFRMVQPGGTVEDGPFIPNADSPCADLTVTPLSPGTDGGLLTGQLQPGAEPLFDEGNNATSNRVAQPVPFFGVAFAIATTDEAAPPVVTAAGGELSGNLAAFAAYYAGQTFNQGAPKPDGSVPGLTTPTATGTIDDDTGAYDLTWASQIVGGSFNDFTGVWHLEGTFTASG